MACLVEMNDSELYESMEMVAREQSSGEQYVLFVMKLLGLMDTDGDAFGEERMEAMMARICKAIKKKGLLLPSIQKMMSRAKEDGKEWMRRVVTWCCGEFYAFASEDVKKEIMNYFKEIRNKPSDPYLLIALAKLPKGEEGLVKEMGASMKGIDCIQTRTLKNVIWAAIKADPKLVLFDVTPQEEAIVPSLTTTDILSIYDEKVVKMDVEDEGIGGKEQRSPTMEKDPFDFW